jgi:cysteine desulfuration protein SufE
VSDLSTLTVPEIIDEFEFLGDWEERCEYLIDLGFALPEMPADEKTEANRVHGCQSNVWLVTRERTDGQGRTVIDVVADSDAYIVKGLIAVLLAMYSGRTPQEILATDAKDIFARLGLDRHLSTARKNGLGGMVTRIRELAARAA